jgi:hypothetical protein
MTLDLFWHEEKMAQEQFILALRENEASELAKVSRFASCLPNAVPNRWCVGEEGKLYK